MSTVATAVANATAACIAASRPISADKPSGWFREVLLALLQPIAEKSVRGVASSDACQNCTAATESATIIFYTIAEAIFSESGTLHGLSASSEANASQTAAIFIDSVVNATAGAVAEVRPAQRHF